jgi:hypothetical protein
MNAGQFDQTIQKRVVMENIFPHPGNAASGRPA